MRFYYVYRFIYYTLRSLNERAGMQDSCSHHWDPRGPKEFARQASILGPFYAMIVVLCLNLIFRLFGYAVQEADKLYKTTKAIYRRIFSDTHRPSNTPLIESNLANIPSRPDGDDHPNSDNHPDGDDNPDSDNHPSPNFDYEKLSINSQPPAELREGRHLNNIHDLEPKPGENTDSDEELKDTEPDTQHLMVFRLTGQYPPADNIEPLQHLSKPESVAHAARWQIHTETPWMPVRKPLTPSGYLVDKDGKVVNANSAGCGQGPFRPVSKIRLHAMDLHRRIRRLERHIYKLRAHPKAYPKFGEVSDLMRERRKALLERDRLPPDLQEELPHQPVELYHLYKPVKLHHPYNPVEPRQRIAPKDWRFDIFLQPPRTPGVLGPVDRNRCIAEVIYKNWLRWDTMYAISKDVHDHVGSWEATSDPATPAILALRRRRLKAMKAHVAGRVEEEDDYDDDTLPDLMDENRPHEGNRAFTFEPQIVNPSPGRGPFRHDRVAKCRHKPLLGEGPRPAPVLPSPAIEASLAQNSPAAQEPLESENREAVGQITTSSDGEMDLEP